MNVFALVVGIQGCWLMVHGRDDGVVYVRVGRHWGMGGSCGWRGGGARQC